MPTIILKKTFKIKPAGFQVKNEKSFSFHGAAASDPQLIGAVNQALGNIRYSNGANRLSFAVDQSGHYYAAMNHDCQKYHEEDIICTILDTMEILGWNFKFEWDSELSSARVNGGSLTSRELYMFHRTG